ncbi:DM13 domain-containing protein [Flavobacterium luteum]|uniref:DM13 domain-containing protein n=1 Tax=Flavobacterium luteum TaxID=2026654 RepID=A0A7J5AD41_9FLAO|nr:DM13 domain-containing protein [Flavobacterium luteum]KAB1155501.1 DM13 domain-containing protein [Flavobacterium luteum]
MKKLLLLTVIILFASCQEEGILTKEREKVVVNPATELKYYGSFRPTSGISVTGEAKIYLENGQYKVVLDNFSISSGPDLKVYLSKAETPTDFVNLGNLTSQTVYQVPTTVSVSDYSHVLIHCQQYNHLFAIAALTSN